MIYRCKLCLECVCLSYTTPEKWIHYFTDLTLMTNSQMFDFSYSEKEYCPLYNDYLDPKDFYGPMVKDDLYAAST